MRPVPALAVLLSLAATPAACRNGDPSVVPPNEDTDPPIHIHPHPEIPPDELGAPAPPREARAAELEPAPAECQSHAEPPPEPPAPPPRIQAGPPVTNYIPPSVIMRPIRARARCFRHCYSQRLAARPELSGKIAIHFVVDLDGWVRKAKVREDTVGDAELAACVAREFVGLQYESPEGGRVSVVYPMLFSPADAGD
ncbi:MAG: AgmX/PglI C-terminal domain-containing protein [Polyangiaceae bacterium]